jgi:hypothetical protein
MIEYKINDDIKPGEFGNFFQGFKYKKEEI